MYSFTSNEKNPKRNFYHFFQLLIKEVGSDGRDRTYDQLINSQLLYR